MKKEIGPHSSFEDIYENRKAFPEVYERIRNMVQISDMDTLQQFHDTDDYEEIYKKDLLPRPNLSCGVKEAIDKAMKFAQLKNHNYIGTEHLLIGLIDAPGVARLVLRDLGNIDIVRSAIDFIIGRASEQPSVGNIGLTPRAERVIELASTGAWQMGERTVGTHHLLLGLIEEDEGIAAGVLESLGITLARAKERIKVRVIDIKKSAS